MPLTLPKNEGRAFEICPAGNHFAVCSSFIDRGTQVVSFPGNPDKLQRLVRIVWEITSEQQSDGRPFYVKRDYSWSMNEKSNLRKDLESWRGAKLTDDDLGPGGFEIKKIIGVGCMLSVIHTDGEKVFANVASIAKMPKGTPTPKLSEPPIYFSLELDEYNPETFDELNDKVKEEIMQSPEWQRIQTIGGTWPKTSVEIDEIPF